MAHETIMCVSLGLIVSLIVGPAIGFAGLGLLLREAREYDGAATATITNRVYTGSVFLYTYEFDVDNSTIPGSYTSSYKLSPKINK